MQTRPFSPDIIFTSIPALLPYLAVTLVVGVTSILTGSILGMLLAWAKLSGHKVIRALADGYTFFCPSVHRLLRPAEIHGGGIWYRHG